MTVRIILAAVCFAAASVVIALAVFGVFKFDFCMNRMHSAALIDSLGLGLILLGLMILSGSFSYIPKLILILVIQWIGSPIASHMVARLEVQTDAKIGEHLQVEEKEVPFSAYTSAGPRASATDSRLRPESAEELTQYELHRRARAFRKSADKEKNHGITRKNKRSDDPTGGDRK